jgi:hypothetical protein
MSTMKLVSCVRGIFRIFLKAIPLSSRYPIYDVPDILTFAFALLGWTIDKSINLCLPLLGMFERYR